MAKKRRRFKKNKSLWQRANPYLRSKVYSLLPKSPIYLAKKPIRRYQHPIASRMPLTARLVAKKVRKLLHDRRLHRPKTDPIDQRFGLYDQRHRFILRAKTIRNRRKATTRLGFADPRQNEICRRRSERRKNLFRINKAGKGKAIRTKKKLNQFSKIRC